jgi:hypothetical protein
MDSSPRQTAALAALGPPVRTMVLGLASAMLLGGLAYVLTLPAA